MAPTTKAVCGHIDSLSVKASSNTICPSTPGDNFAETVFRKAEVMTLIDSIPVRQGMRIIHALSNVKERAVTVAFSQTYTCIL